jgi:integrase
MAKPRKHGKVWYARYKNAAGKWVEVPLPARTSAEAKEQSAELAMNARAASLGLKRLTLPPCVREVYGTYEKVAKSEAGWRAKRSRFKLDILPALGGKRLHEVTPADVEELMASVQGPPRNLSPQSADHIRVAIAGLYTYAIKRKRLYDGANPGLLARKADIPQRPPRVLELPDLVALLAQVSPRWRNLFALSALTGLRMGEVKALTVRDVDLKRRLLFVYKSNARKVLKQGSKLNVVPVSSDALPYLEAAVREAKSEWLFSDDMGRMLPAWKSFVPELRRAMVKAGLVQGYDLICRRKSCRTVLRSQEADQSPCPKCGFKLWPRPIPVDFVFHNLRSTAATHHLEATDNIKFVQAMLGHADSRTTDRYAKIRPARMVALADRLMLPQPVPKTDGDSRGFGESDDPAVTVESSAKATT